MDYFMCDDAASQVAYRPVAFIILRLQQQTLLLKS